MTKIRHSGRQPAILLSPADQPTHAAIPATDPKPIAKECSCCAGSEPNPSSAHAELLVAAKREHRMRNFWEPTYDGCQRLDEALVWPDLFVVERNGPVKFHVRGKICLGTDLQHQPQNRIEHVIFETCDFFGEFKPSRQLLSVNNCSFSKCSFEDSRWIDVRFRNCEFSDCAFGIVQFERCVFDEKTTFERISVSGDFTKFTNTTLSADKFLDAVISKPQVGAAAGKPGSKEWQEDRLTETLRKVAYGVLQSVSTCEEPAIRATAYKAYQKRRWASTNKRGKIEASKGFRGALFRGPKLLFPFVVELGRTGFGWATDWGTSLTRLVGIYMGAIAIATGAYGNWLTTASSLAWTEWPGKLGVGLRAAIEVQLLFGYTNYSAVGTWCRAGMLAHAVFATFLYIALAAMLARESMARNPNA